MNNKLAYLLEVIIFWFKFTSGSIISKFQTSFIVFLLSHIHYQNLKQSSKTQIGKENYTPKISRKHL